MLQAGGQYDGAIFLCTGRYARFDARGYFQEFCQKSSALRLIFSLPSGIMIFTDYNINDLLRM